MRADHGPCPCSCRSGGGWRCSPHRMLVLSSVQTMVYTIHEIPIFIAMGVVGKGRPTEGRFLSPPRWQLATSSGVRVCGGVRACQTPGLAQL